MSVLLWYDIFYPKTSELPNSGLSLTEDDLLSIFSLPKHLAQACPYFQSLSKDSLFNSNKYQINVDVQHFNPTEICVKILKSDQVITVEAEHNERTDEHGFIKRHFLRRYILPKDGKFDLNRIESKLSSDGVLSISVPKLENFQLGNGEKEISIVQTGQPFKRIVEINEQVKEE